MGEVTSVFAHLRRLNPLIRGEDSAHLLLTFRDGNTALWDANRYNEADTDTPRFTFCQLRIDAMKGHLTMGSNADIRLKVLGEQAQNIDYPHERRNFAGDCVYNLQRHFVDCMLSAKSSNRMEKTIYRRSR